MGLRPHDQCPTDYRRRDHEPTIELVLAGGHELVPGVEQHRLSALRIPEDVGVEERGEVLAIDTAVPDQLAGLCVDAAQDAMIVEHVEVISSGDDF